MARTTHDRRGGQAARPRLAAQFEQRRPREAIVGVIQEFLAAAESAREAEQERLRRAEGGCLGEAATAARQADLTGRWYTDFVTGLDPLGLLEELGGRGETLRAAWDQVVGDARGPYWLFGRLIAVQSMALDCLIDLLRPDEPELARSLAALMAVASLDTSQARSALS